MTEFKSSTSSSLLERRTNITVKYTKVRGSSNVCCQSSYEYLRRSCELSRVAADGWLTGHSQWTETPHWIGCDGWLDGCCWPCANLINHHTITRARGRARHKNIIIIIKDTRPDQATRRRRRPHQTKGWESDDEGGGKNRWNQRNFLSLHDVPKFRICAALVDPGINQPTTFKSPQTQMAHTQRTWHGTVVESNSRDDWMISTWGVVVVGGLDCGWWEKVGKLNRGW